MASIQDLLLPAGDCPQLKRGPRGSSPSPKPATSQGTTHFTIEFILDTICPHCYVGLKNLNTAIDVYKEHHPEATFEVTCSPLVLNPHAARSAYSKQEYYVWQRKYPVARLSEWVELGAGVGVDFSWTGLTGNTRDSHKLLRLALEGGPPTTLRSTAFTAAMKTPSGPSCSPGTGVPRQSSAELPGHRGPAAQMRLLETMYHEYFELDKDISSHAFLADVGSRVLGIPAAEVLDCLEREDWDQATEMLIDDVRNRGFRAIPQFILQEKYLAGGWQQPSFFLDVFEQIRKKGSHTRAGSEGGGQRAQEADANEGRPG